MIRRVEDAGFSIDAMLGDYRGRAWDKRADVWIILATRTSRLLSQRPPEGECKRRTA